MVHKKAPKLTKKCRFWILLECVGRSESSSEDREQIMCAGFLKNENQDVSFCAAKHETKQHCFIKKLIFFYFPSSACGSHVDSMFTAAAVVPPFGLLHPLLRQTLVQTMQAMLRPTGPPSSLGSLSDA